MTRPTPSLLKLESLSVCFGKNAVLDDVSLELGIGETLGIVGESGCGKSLTALALLGLLGRVGATVRKGILHFDSDRYDLSETHDLASIRGSKIALITQNPMTSLDPLWTIGAQLAETLTRRGGLRQNAAQNRSLELLASMRIPSPRDVLKLYPMQLSGGLRQRIVIALALASSPKLIVADEPTTALDVTVQAQVVSLLERQCSQGRIGMILITHDMGIVAQTCDRVSVMYAGRVIEEGAVGQLFGHPRHPYTKALLNCIPKENMERGELQPLGGFVPRVGRYPSGCRFHPRCSKAMAICQRTVPELTSLDDQGSVACHLYTPLLEEVR